MTENSPAVEPVIFDRSPLRAPLVAWMREGLRAGFFLRPRMAGCEPHAWQLVVLLVLLSLLEVGLARIEVDGPAAFDLRGWLAPSWSTAAMALLVWTLLPSSAAQRAPTHGGLAAWLALWFMALLPSGIVAQGLAIADERGLTPDLMAESMWLGPVVYLGLWVWTVGAGLRLGWHFGLGRKRLSGLALGLTAIFGINAWQFPDRPWRAEETQAAGLERPRLELSQETYEAQQAVWRRSIEAIAKPRAGVTNVYALLFAPYASEDVFLRETSMVAEVLAERFDARGRVLHLVNHATTVETHPWATPLNLKRGIEALARRMDSENDLLIVYLTSHGASNFRLAASHWPLQVQQISPRELREALDAAGIRNRVIVVSACYSGGWIGPLASDTTLVMTAADADHTSYGCGRLSQLTYFGRAMFDEQLRKTRDFEQAFAAAVPLIRQREQEAGKPDGFSNPQISVGEKIRPLLQRLQARLGQ